jgi:hypothetical protein
MTHPSENPNTTEQAAAVKRIIDRNTPTDDAREVARTFAEAVGWRWDALESVWQEAFIGAARKIAGFRRPEVPSADCPQCHRPDGMHKLGCGERFGAEPHGEPSDAAVRAALGAWIEAKQRGIPDTNLNSMRAALRAASEGDSWLAAHDAEVRAGILEKSKAQVDAEAKGVELGGYVADAHYTKWGGSPQ